MTTARQENARTLAAAIGRSGVEAEHLLDAEVLITCAPSGVRLADYIEALLARTLAHVRRERRWLATREKWLRKCSRSPTRSHGSLRDRFSPLARSRKCERLRILVVGGREPGRSLGFALSPRDNCGGQARRVRPGWPLARFGARAAQRCPGVGARHTGATARHHPGPNVPSM